MRCWLLCICCGGGLIDFVVGVFECVGCFVFQFVGNFMKLFVVGFGGCEYVLVWKFVQLLCVQMVYVVFGNGGMVQDECLKNVDIMLFDEFVDFVECEGVVFMFVGLEVLFVVGIVNLFCVCGLKVFGLICEVVQFESLKDFVKVFMKCYNILIVDYEIFFDVVVVYVYIDVKGVLIVVKVDGFVVGKGVVVVMMFEEVYVVVDMMLLGNKFGDVGVCVVIEEFFDGEEVSFIVMVDGKYVLVLVFSQDYKCLFDEDCGLNIGGMGVYLFVLIVMLQMYVCVMCEIIMLIVCGMEKDGICFIGFLYVGLMIDKDGNLCMFEFNCWMGDLEMQLIMVCLKSDFLKVVEQVIVGMFDMVEFDWDCCIVFGVVLVVYGYLDVLCKGDCINGILVEIEQVVMFYVGMMFVDGDKFVMFGGCVLCVVGFVDLVCEVQQYVYDMINQINFEGMQYCCDIGFCVFNCKSV